MASRSALLLSFVFRNGYFYCIWCIDPNAHTVVLYEYDTTFLSFGTHFDSQRAITDTTSYLSVGFKRFFTSKITCKTIFIRPIVQLKICIFYLELLPYTIKYCLRQICNSWSNIKNLPFCVIRPSVAYARHLQNYLKNK